MHTLRRILFSSVSRSRYLAHVDQCRQLSVSETAAALRPFLFAVHPDLFGQYPQARAVNEESLKNLNEYIDTIRIQQRVSPQTLLFYLRDTTPLTVATTPTKYGHFKTVRIPLLSSCPRETVTSVLRSCNLPLDYIDSLGSKDTRGNRAVKWDNSFYSFWGIPNPEEPPKPRVDDTLSVWLRRELQTCRARLHAIEPIRVQIEALKRRLVEVLGVAEVLWECGWGLTAYRACLLGILRLHEANPFIKDALKGHRLVFGLENGVCIRGDVILRHDDVPSDWMPLLRSLHKHNAILNKLPAAEQHLSSLLHGAQIVSKEAKATMLSENYLLQLRKTSSALREYKASHPDHALKRKSMEKLRLVQECTQGSLHISSSGEIYIPASCPVFLLIDFINEYAKEAIYKHKQYKGRNHQTLRLLEEVKQHLQLASLTCDTNVSRVQLTSCLQRLLVDSELNAIDLSGARLNISHFYSVMSDGEMYVPWNWRSYMDDE